MREISCDFKLNSQSCQRNGFQEKTMIKAPSRTHSTLRAITTFGVVGVLSTITHLIVGLSLTTQGLFKPFTANIIAFVLAFFVSYSGHKSYSFQSDLPHCRAMPRFFSVACIGLVLNQFIVYSVVSVLERPYWQALVLIITLIPAIVYLAGRYWAFKPLGSE